MSGVPSPKLWNEGDNSEDQEKREELAKALGRISSGLYILTSCGDGTPTGALVSWVQQCSFQPPAVSVALRRDRPLVRALAASRPFVLNVLEESQMKMVAHFGRGFRLGEPAFEGVAIEFPQPAGPPVLRDALAYLECRLMARYGTGDHELLIGEVLGGQLLRDGKPLLHTRNNGMRY